MFEREFDLEYISLQCNHLFLLKDNNHCIYACSIYELLCVAHIDNNNKCVIWVPIDRLMANTKVVAYVCNSCLDKQPLVFQFFVVVGLSMK